MHKVRVSLGIDSSVKYCLTVDNMRLALGATSQQCIPGDVAQFAYNDFFATSALFVPSGPSGVTRVKLSPEVLAFLTYSRYPDSTAFHSFLGREWALQTFVHKKKKRTQLRLRVEQNNFSS